MINLRKSCKTSLTYLMPIVLPVMAYAVCAIIFMIFRGDGPMWGTDTRVRYVPIADILRREHFSLFDWMQAPEMQKKGSIMMGYSLFTYIIAVSRELSQTYWEYFVIAINILSTSFSIAFLISFLRARDFDIRAILLSSMCCVLCLDYFSWSAWILTDAIFCALSTSAIVSLLWALTEKKVSYSLLSLSAVLSLFCYLQRPNGSVVWMFFVLMLGYYFISRSKSEWASRIGLILMAMVCVVTILVHGYLLDKAYEFTDHDGLLWTMLQNIRIMYDQGNVINNRFETYSLPPTSWIEYSLLSFKKLIYFFHFLPDFWSNIHKVNAVLTYPVLYLGVLGSGVLIFTKRLNANERFMIVGCLLFIFIVSGLHAITAIDGTWRYRLPTLPIMCILTSISLTKLLMFFGLGKNSPEKTIF